MDKKEEAKEEPEVKLLIIIPSHVFHCVRVHDGQENWYTTVCLSFNSATHAVRSGRQ